MRWYVTDLGRYLDDFATIAGNEEVREHAKCPKSLLKSLPAQATTGKARPQALLGQTAAVQP
jgi:hypothetical protein